jgi:phage gp29-like protein
MKLIPPERYPNLIQLINRTYTDEVEQILSAGVDKNGTIICLAQDGNKQLAIEIGDNDVQIRLFNPTTQFSQQQDTPDQIATNLQKLGDPIVGGWLHQIEQVLTTSDDLETAREALFQLYPDLESTELTQQMTAATAAASMAGFWEAEQDANR